MHIQSFESFEEAQQAMREAEERANAQVFDRQRSIGYGDYWCRPVPEYGVFVFGYVWPQDKAEKGEARSTVTSLRDSFERGYRFGDAYSVMEPEGELGTTHVANMWPISEEDFIENKAHNWQPTIEFVERIFREANEAKRQQNPSSLDDEASFEVVEEDDNA